MWSLLFAALLGFGIWLMIKSNRMEHEIKRYEFNNRTDGGVVQFESYEHSLEHGRKRRRMGDTFAVGGFFFVVGGIGLVLTLIF